MAETIKDKPLSADTPKKPLETAVEGIKRHPVISVIILSISATVPIIIGTCNYFENREKNKQKQTARLEENHREKHIKLLDSFKTIDIEVTTKLEDQKLELIQPTTEKKTQVQFKDGNDEKQTWWFPIIEKPKIGETSSIGLDEYEAPVQFKTIIDDVTVIYSAKAWAERGKESSYVLTFNQE